MNERVLLLTLAALQFTHIVDFMILMPLGPQLMRLFGITPQQFGLLVSCYTISAGVSSFLGSFYLDRFGRRTALLTFYAGFALGTLCCAFAPSYEILCAARIATGAFGGVLGSLIFAIVGDVIPFERRASAMGTVMTAFAMASVLGVPAGIYLASYGDWHMPFVVLSVLSIFVGILVFRVVPPLRDHMAAKHTARPPLFAFLGSVLRNGNQLNAIALMTFMMLGQFAVIPFVSPYMVANVGFSERELPYLYFTGGLVSMITLPMIGRIADRIGKRKVFLFLTTLAIVPLLLVTHLPPVGVPLALVATTFFFFCIGGRGVPASAMITATVPPQQRGSFMSLVSSAQQLAAGVGSSIASIIVTKGTSGELLHYPIVGYFAAGTCILCIIAAATLRLPEQQPKQA